MRNLARMQRLVAAALFSLSFVPAFVWAQIDPLASAKTLRPEALVDAVLQDNPLLSAAQWAWQAAESEIAPAGALDDPMLSTMVAPRTFGKAEMDPGVGIELSQRLPWPGKRGLREKIARFEARAIKQSIPNTRLDLTELAKAAFADWYLVHAALQVNEANRKLWQDVREIDH